MVLSVKHILQLTWSLDGARKCTQTFMGTWMQMSSSSQERFQDELMANVLQDLFID